MVQVRAHHSVCPSLFASTQRHRPACCHHRESACVGRAYLPHFHKHHRACRGLCARAAPDSEGQQGSRGLDPGLEVAVPRDQRPVNELAQLRQSSLYSWATLDGGEYVKRLALLYAAVFALLGGPIAYQTFDPFSQPLEFILSGSVGSLLVVSVASLRIYLGWAYVGNRLLSATVEYEETGWYDGQVFVKPPEVLARDRLLGAYEVKPRLRKLKTTLVSLGAALMLSAVLLFVTVRTQADSDGMYGRGAARSPRITPTGVIYSSNVKSLEDFADDDDAAAAEAAAQNGIPGYCGDRYFRAMASSHFCERFDGPPRNAS